MTIGSMKKFFHILKARNALNPNQPDLPDRTALRSRNTLHPGHVNPGNPHQEGRILHHGHANTDDHRNIYENSQSGSVNPEESFKAVQLGQDDLGNTISTEMNEYEIGLDVKKHYLPDAVRLKLINEHNINKTLSGASPELVKFIVEKASKTFAITLLAIRDSDNRLSAMEAFHRHEFTDEEYLPVEKLTASDRCKNGWKCGHDCITGEARSCVHSSQLDVFHHACWDSMSFNDFYVKQWGFLLQKFDLEKFQYDEVDEMVILPFILGNNEKNERAGNFGEVLHAEMLTEMLVDPQALLKMGNQSYISVAIKTLKPPADDPNYDIPSEWKKESKAHKELNALGHENIITAFAAFRQGRKYHLLLEWANGGSLKTHWKENPKPNLNKDSTKKLLQQLLGLADALYCLHKTAIARRRSESRSKKSAKSERLSESRSRKSATSERLSVQDFQTVANGQNRRVNTDRPIEVEAGASQDGLPKFQIEDMDDDLASGTTVEGNEDSLPLQLNAENWRHGDIKPDNILRFTDELGLLELGTLKLADLGRAKQNERFTRHNPLIEIDVWRSKPYEPPDIILSRGRRSMSRLYDIWSMGCVFFESIIWMLYGHQYQQAFMGASQTTRESQAQGSPYWTRIGQTAKVSEMVSFGMARIFQDDPGCRPIKSALGDVLKLVQEKLLVVELPENSDVYTRGRRTNAEELRNDLEQILRKAEEDDEYAWTTEDRSKVVPPPLGVEYTPRKRSSTQQSGMSTEKTIQQSLLIPPSSQGPRVLTTGRHNHYTHFINDEWLVVDDDAFAKRTVQMDTSDYTKLYEFPDPNLCPSCRNIDISRYGTVLSKSIDNLSVRNCSLCALLSGCARKSGLDNSGTIFIDRVAAGLKLNGQPGLVLRVCRSFNTAGGSSAITTIGLPQLPKAESKPHITTICSWLKDCDSRHSCIPKQVQMYVPSRLLDINPDNDPKWGSTTSQIVETRTLKFNEKKTLEYVALSHPWGDPKKHEHFCSYPENIETHLQGIDDDELPATFEDAVKITRQLKKKYLWVDSLCILQGPQGDFQAQAGHMQDIFSSAYCVLAASSAEGMASGFLKKRTKPKVVVLEQDTSISQPPQDKLYICETLDNFQHDVIESPLNQRGWVLQERALARRTIYFTTNQTYWECSDGIRCETLSKVQSKEAAFLGDSNFPFYAVQGKNIGAQLYLFTRLYEQYSRLSFSHLFDKPLAISGLEQRLTKVFDDYSGAGVFKKRWGRFLLWTRAEDVPTLSRIAFTATPKTGAERTPTWSWMAYDGGITFLDPPGGKIAWDQKTAAGLFLTGTAATSWLYSDEILSFKAEVRDFVISTDSNQDEISLMYDMPQGSEGRDRKCISIGRLGEASDPGARHYVLLVSLKVPGTSYERIGAGYLPGRLIKDLETPVDMVKIE